jgi:hypothetical protein
MIYPHSPTLPSTPFRADPFVPATLNEIDCFAFFLRSDKIDYEPNADLSFWITVEALMNQSVMTSRHRSCKITLHNLPSLMIKCRMALNNRQLCE